MISNLIDSCIRECKKEKNRKRIDEEVISPIIEMVLVKLKPFLIGACIFLALVIPLMLCILFLVIFKK